MMAILLLVLCVLGGVLLLTLLFFLVVQVSDDTVLESQPKNTIIPDTEKILTGNESHQESRRAVIHCAVYPPLVPVRFRAAGYTECKTLNMVFGGNVSCLGGCLGLESCAAICPNDAIVFRKGEVYISDACNGCGHCIHVCPKKLIELVPVSAMESVSCAAFGKGDSSSFCPVAMDQIPYVIEYRKFPISGFKILHKWGILGKK